MDHLEESTARESTASGSDRITILLVEDDRGTALVMSRLLLRLGYSVRTAGCISEALKIVDGCSIQILLSDIGLPDGTGYELMSEVRKRCGAVGVAMTGFDGQDDVENSKAAGFSRHLVKPIDFSRLQAMLSDICEKSRQMGE